MLDEAIREHLELKRRRGGDPTEIAREEREALEPVFPTAAGSDEGESPQGPLEPIAAEDPPLAAADFSHVGEETAELDMQSVLGVEEMLTEEHSSLGPEGGEDEEFEWDPPRGEGHGPPDVDPGQERLSFE